jgi:hypothetical protein
MRIANIAAPALQHSSYKNHGAGSWLLVLDPLPIRLFFTYLLITLTLAKNSTLLFSSNSTLPCKSSQEWERPFVVHSTVQ